MLAKARPGQITFGSAGIGSGSHLGGELFQLLAGVNLVHVPYKGSALVTTALLSGEVAVAFSNPTSSLPHVKAGRLRMVAVTTRERWPLLPQLPTIAESGVPGFESIVWYAMFAPAGTPPDITRQLNAEINRILQQPDAREHFLRIGMVPVGGTMEALGEFLKIEIARWAKVVKEAGIKPIE